MPPTFTTTVTIGGGLLVRFNFMQTVKIFIGEIYPHRFTAIFVRTRFRQIPYNTIPNTTWRINRMGFIEIQYVVYGPRQKRSKTTTANPYNVM